MKVIEKNANVVGVSVEPAMILVYNRMHLFSRDYIHIVDGK